AREALRRELGGLAAENRRLLRAVEVSAERCALTRATANVQSDVGQLLRLVRDVREEVLCLGGSGGGGGSSSGPGDAAERSSGAAGGGSPGGASAPAGGRLMRRGSIDASLCAAVCDALGWGGGLDEARRRGTAANGSKPAAAAPPPPPAVIDADTRATAPGAWPQAAADAPPSLLPASSDEVDFPKTPASPPASGALACP
ncbi:hypothetical protein MNEG_2227, partial [Monoraphidium neglectum]